MSRKKLIYLNGLKTLMVINWTMEKQFTAISKWCGSGGGQTKTLREVYHFIFAQQRHINQELSSKIIFVTILDGDECNRKINLLPRIEREQIFIGSLFEWNENIKGNQ